MNKNFNLLFLIYKIKKIILKIYFFFIKNKNKRKNILIKILGEEIKTKYIYEYWYQYGLNSRVLMTCEQYYNKSSAMDWLVYASILLKLKQYKKLKIIINEYIIKYNLKMIDNFLPLSNYLNNSNISNENIRKSANLFNILEKNKKDKILNKIIKNKTIAIIGNSDSEIKKEKGKEIDNFEIIIRFNNYRIKNYYIDYGIKTNIWVINNVKDIIMRDDNYVKTLSLIITRVDIWNNAINDNIRDMLFYYSTNLNIPILYIDESIQKDLRAKSKVKDPTSGILIFYYIYKLKKYKTKEIKLYGFSFLQKEKNNYSHYYEILSEIASNGVREIHEMNKQNIYFAKIFNL